MIYADLLALDSRTVQKLLRCNLIHCNELKSVWTKVIASIVIFLYHLQTLKQKLWITLIMYLAYYIDKQQLEGCLMDEMNKLTLLESPTLFMRHRCGKNDTCLCGFFIISDYMNQSVAPKFAPTLPL